jgi:sulfite reductase beta subunit-like hemoprotein
VEIPPFDDKIRKLCALALSASEEDAEAILKELKKALQEHNDYVRQMVAGTLKRIA